MLDKATKLNLTSCILQNFGVSGGEGPCLVISTAKASFSYLKRKPLKKTDLVSCKNTTGPFPNSDDATETTTNKRK